jgi:GTP-binding protein
VSLASLPVVVLLGRPNVGKSTLFNRLTRSRDALVADFPGLTRDRQYGYGRIGPVPYLAVDTGGLSGDTEGLDALSALQAHQALDEADAILFLVDARDGLSAQDEILAQRVRRAGKPVFLVANKSEGLSEGNVDADFASLGLGSVHAVSAAHGQGVATLMETVATVLPSAVAPERESSDTAIRVAVVGRPNVGKSTLINRVLGENRLVASEIPGTTRDAIAVPFTRADQDYVLVDTAGVRRRARVDQPIEKFSIVKTLQAIDAADVVLFLFDGREGVTEQDASLLGLVIERGRAVVLAVNKWDGLSPGARERIREELLRRLPFADFAQTHFISALRGSGIGGIFTSIKAAHAAGSADLSTPQLTRLLQEATTVHQPPLVRGRRIKLRYAHQGGRQPPVIVVHGNQTENIPDAYRRFLVNFFRKSLQLAGTPMRIEFKSGENPYEGVRNQLSVRQINKRRRMIKHYKKLG